MRSSAPQVSDITYIWTNEGWVYLAAVKDLYSKELVGHALNKRMTSDLVCQALNNAIKYSPAGGKITVSLEQTNTQVVLRITDEGLGIPKKDLPKIFDRFYRVDKARSREQGGTGLGLAIVRDIVKMHDGFVWAKSDGETGTTFTVVLPYAPLEAENDPEVDDWIGLSD